MKLIGVGDVHLGRRPGGLAAAGLDPRLFSPVEAFRRVVDRALESKVDAVVLAGDVVDDERDRFEAYGHLEGGVRRLVSGGVAVFAVAGNHDGVALPRLASRIDGFRLIGRGGRWERVPVDAAGELDLIGWSFTGRAHRIRCRIRSGVGSRHLTHS